MKTKYILLVVMFLSASVMVQASEISGTLSTGLSGSINGPITGTVRSSGGGGGGGSSRVLPKIEPVATTTPTSTPVINVSAATSSGVVLGISTYRFSRHLGIGIQGEDVIELQKRLIKEGYTGLVTGYFGPITRNAVRSFQLANNLPGTGFVGPLTLNRLNGDNTGERAALLIKISRLRLLLAQLMGLKK